MQGAFSLLFDKTTYKDIPVIDRKNERDQEYKLSEFNQVKFIDDH